MVRNSFLNGNAATAFEHFFFQRHNVAMMVSTFYITLYMSHNLLIFVLLRVIECFNSLYIYI
jgi:hypothetical protein